MTNAKHSSATNSADAIGRSRVKGKVKEFVKIFNQETTALPKTEFESKSTRKGIGINGTENGMSSAVKTNQKVHKVNKNKMPEASIRVLHISVIFLSFNVYNLTKTYFFPENSGFSRLIFLSCRRMITSTRIK